MPRITDIIDIENYNPPIVPADEVKGQDLEVSSYEKRQGEKGDYYVFTCTTEDNEEPILVSCGGKIIVEIFDDFDPKKLPVTMRFKRVGRMWLVE